MSKKCCCGHSLGCHYIAYDKKTPICGKDNCTMWNMCDIDPEEIRKTCEHKTIKDNGYCERCEQLINKK